MNTIVTERPNKFCNIVIAKLTGILLFEDSPLPLPLYTNNHKTQFKASIYSASLAGPELGTA
jgi:hypothetical protein